ncbi:MAG TPA: hydrogenase expression/formation protein HypE, partial [bacterium]|nr:hydrogenase expression/formation protein HypE [bacterium]
MAEELITLAHGSGGRPMQQLIQEVFLKFFDHPALTALTDAACLSWPSSYQLCFTTDAYVVQPLFFPGGNIGKLAFCGTINDLAVSGAQPLYLSCAFIIEEGFSVALLEKILASMKQMVCQTGVAVVTGDTKVVERGKLDGLCIATSGVGIRPASLKLCRESLRPGDKVIVSGPLGDHEIAILSARGKFQLETRLASDCAPLHSLTERMLKVEPNLRFMRDPTRGGLAAVLNEIVSGLKVGILIEEKLLPVRKEVAACCEILGLDPLLLASEGRLVAVVPEKT